MCAGLSGVAVADVLSLIQDGGQAALLDRELQMQPGEVSAGLGDLRQSVARQIDDGKRLRHGAQARDQLRTLLGDGLGAHDEGEPVVRTFGGAAQLCQIVKAEGLKVQKLEQSYQSSRLRV